MSRGPVVRAPVRTARFGERGQFAGIEVVPFGLLVIVVGALVVANVWAVVDVRFAVAAAARDATRSYVETPAGDDPWVRARAAAEEAMAGMGRDGTRVQVRLVEGSLTRCARVELEVSYAVPALTVPWVRTFGSPVNVTARHGEIVDPYRSGLDVVEGRPCAP